MDELDVPLPPPDMQRKLREKAEELLADAPVTKDDALLESAFNKTIDHEDVVNSQVPMFEDKGAKELFDAEDVETKTDLTPREIVAISKIKFMAEQYGIPVFHSIARNHMLLKISLLRKSRREFIEAKHAEQQRQQAMMGGGSAIDWIKEKLGG